MNGGQHRCATLGNALMTFHYTSRIALLFAAAFAATALSARPSLAFSSEAQQMCTGDAMRLCGHEVPNVQRITACMHKLRAQVSPGCRAVMERENTARRRAAATDE
jgi:predicted lysophospholipase L1 biosynthesis ABC-type transport system permease subunit